MNPQFPSELPKKQALPWPVILENRAEADAVTLVSKVSSGVLIENSAFAPLLD